MGLPAAIMSNNKQLDRSFPVNLSEIKFNELDNWLGIMDVDPPESREEKQAMYDRLLDILADMFEPEENNESFQHVDKRLLFKDMRKIIER
jgi:hypothetical protein